MNSRFLFGLAAAVVALAINARPLSPVQLPQ